MRMTSTESKPAKKEIGGTQPSEEINELPPEVALEKSRADCQIGNFFTHYWAGNYFFLGTLASYDLASPSFSWVNLTLSLLPFCFMVKNLFREGELSSREEHSKRLVEGTSPAFPSPADPGKRMPVPDSQKLIP
jgi:hypothetical protein